MEEKQTFGQKVKGHFKRHKNKYITGGVVALAGATCYYIGRRTGGVKTIPTINNIVSPVFNNNNNVNMGGYSHKLVKCLETGQIWETVKDAAEAAGVSVPLMSKHVNGKCEHVKGNHYEIIGLGTA